MDIEELKRRAVNLEQELFSAANESPDVAAFAKYEPLLSAIRRAKAGEITKTEEIPGMHYWHFETGIFWKFKAMAEAFAKFDLLLKGLER